MSQMNDKRGTGGGRISARKRPEYRKPRRDQLERPGEAVLARAENYLVNHEKELPDEKYPTIPGLAGHLKLTTPQIIEWRNKAETCPRCREFEEICQAVQDKLHRILLNEGIEGFSGQSVTSLILQSEYGYTKRDHQTAQIEETIRVDSNISPEEAEKRYREFMGSDPKAKGKPKLSVVK